MMWSACESCLRSASASVKTRSYSLWTPTLVVRSLLEPTFGRAWYELPVPEFAMKSSMLNYALDAHGIKTVDQFDMFAIQQIFLLRDDSNVATGGNYDVASCQFPYNLSPKLASRELEGPKD